MKKSNIFLSFFLVYIIVNIILLPQVYVSASYNGMRAWAISVLPAILPFMFFTKALTSLGAINKISHITAKPCQKLFNCSDISSIVFLTSIISGYPVGAAMTASFYQAGKISKSEAYRMCSFCSTSGPMFIVGAVGIAMLQNVQYGYIILFSHLIGALLNGILYKKLTVADNYKDAVLQNATSCSDISSITQETVMNVLCVGVIISIFFVIITSLNPVFQLFPNQISCILEGLIEITKGCSGIAQNWSGIPSIIATTFIISFGGLSTILQSIAFLSKLQMPLKLFILQKTTHAILAMGVSIVLCMIFI